MFLIKRINQKKLLDKNYVAEEIYKLLKSKIKSGSVVIIDEEKWNNKIN